MDTQTSIPIFATTSSERPAVQNAPANATAPADERPWLTFPPFPKPPPGVELIPFKDFKPAGIHVVQDPEPGHVEVDGLGIPTLTLRVHHDLSAMEKRKRKASKRYAVDGTVRRLIWYDEWAESENLRRLSAPIDPSTPRSDRLHSAADDFKAGRPLHQSQELAALWDRFRVFVGLIISAQPAATRRKQAAMRMAAAAEQEDDDDDDEDAVPSARPPQERTINVVDGEDAPGMPSAVPAVPSTSTMTDEQRDRRREYYREVRDTRMDRFLNDPEKCTKIFLSGYASDRGMLASEKFCRDGPILLKFFLSFLQRNRVFPESDKDIRKAIALTELAAKELPQTFVISRALPDGFGKGCKLLFGTMDDFMIWQAKAGDAEDHKDDASEPEPEAKRQKTEGASPTTTAAVLQAAIGDQKIEVITPDVAMSMEKEVEQLATGASANGEPTQDPPAAEGEPIMWGNDDTSGGNDPWGEPSTTDDWGAGPTENPLTRLLGPTMLPLTHTTGVIERSTRRIKSIILPPSPSAAFPQKKAKKGGKSEPSGTPDGAPAPPDPEAVERELEAKYARVTFAPWHEWDMHPKADVQKPRLLPDSRGAAVTDDRDDAEVTPGPGAPHNPFKDEITVCLEPAAAATMLVGMAIEALWVQLARVDVSVPIEVDPAVFENPWGYDKKRAQGGPGVPVAPTKIWYMEQVRGVLPSFHTEMIPLPTTEDVFGEEA